MDEHAKRILIVDDQESNRRLLADVLAEARYSVHMASDGYEAFVHMRRTRYDAIVTDWEMPRVNGQELVTLVRFLWPYTPIIVVSGQARPSSYGEHRGTVAWLRKPFAVHDLLDLLDHAIDTGAHRHRDGSAATASV
ncbi:Fis family transcriptional regulator [Nitrospira sp.]|nr:Fis family transcriptional regulator [Nitrospira sp.]